MKNKRPANEVKDNSPIIPQRGKIKNELNIKENFVLTNRQKEFLDLAFNKDTKMMFVSGPAGTSKTFISVYCALKLLNERKVSELIYVRSAVECSDSRLGFLPGEVNEKMLPYVQPLLDKLDEFLPKGDIDTLMKEKRIVAIPIGFLRGLNFNAKVLIGDEFQNCTYKEIFTFITRIGEFSKVFILGDVDQSDINGKSGFQKMISLFDDEESRQNGIYTFKFNEEDIVRSKLLKFIIKKITKTN